MVGQHGERTLGERPADEHAEPVRGDVGRSPGMFHPGERRRLAQLTMMPVSVAGWGVASARHAAASVS